MDYPVELYRAIHRGNPGDSEHYRRACSAARAVLELGAGYGRLVRAILGSAERYVGLELRPEFAAAARQVLDEAPQDLGRRGRIVVGDMADFALPERFDRVLLPHSVLFCLPSHTAMQQGLECAVRHLTQNGEVWGDTYHADPLHGPADEVTPETWLTATSIGGRLYQVSEQSRWIAAQQRVRVTYRYASAGARDCNATIEHCYVLRRDFPDLFQRAGLRLVDVWGDFRRGRFREESEFFVFRAVRA